MRSPEACLDLTLRGVEGAAAVSSSGLLLCRPLGPGCCSLRYGLAVIMHFSNFTLVTQRVSLSIAVIAMVNGTQQTALSNVSAAEPAAEALEDPGRPIQEFNTGVRGSGWRRRCVVGTETPVPLEDLGLHSVASRSARFNDKLKRIGIIFV